jgi:hypothetical protein
MGNREVVVIYDPDTGHYVGVDYKDDDCCTWCGRPPVRLVLWHYTAGDLVCLVHAQMLRSYGAIVSRLEPEWAA